MTPNGPQFTISNRTLWSEELCIMPAVAWMKINSWPIDDFPSMLPHKGSSTSSYSVICSKLRAHTQRPGNSSHPGCLLHSFFIVPQKVTPAVEATARHSFR